MLERSEESNTLTCHPERVKRRGISINTKEEIPHTWLTLAPTGVDLRFGMTEPQGGGQSCECLKFKVCGGQYTEYNSPSVYRGSTRRGEGVLSIGTINFE